MTYAWDVFLSYRREVPVAPWVHEHFLPLFEHWLAESTAYETKVFVDTRMETGEHWPKTLKDALRRSKLLVPVWSPRYFRSRWCMSEWQSIVQREQLLGIPNATERQGLVVPIRFCDGVHFPMAAQETQMTDMVPFNFSVRAFADSLEYPQFEAAVKTFALMVSGRLTDVPEWQEDFPIVETEPLPHQVAALPRLGS